VQAERDRLPGAQGVVVMASGRPDELESLDPRDERGEQGLGFETATCWPTHW
jgi:hypothetical protein